MCMFPTAMMIFAYAPLGVSIHESDIWWHLLNARTLLDHHSLSSVDVHTFTVAGAPWMSFEWLSEIPFYLAFRTAAWQGVLLVYSVLMVLIFAGIYYRSCRAGADCKNAALVTLAAIRYRNRFPGAPNFVVRLALPHRVVARGRPFPQDRKRTLDSPSSLCSLDQSARILDLRYGHLGTDDSFGPGPGRMGHRRSPALESSGTAKTYPGHGDFLCCAFCQSFRL